MPRFWEQRQDLVFILLLLGGAAALRLPALDTIPPGLHGDEAYTGMDAQRVLREGWIGPYVGSALGQPTGPLYWAALILKVFGSTAYTVRLSMAILGIATVPLLYVTARLMFDRPTALISAFILAVMMWHVHFSRVAFMLISWPLMEVVVAGLLFLALKTGKTLIFGFAGIVLGAGVYTYNAYPLFAVAIGVFAFLIVLQRKEKRVLITGQLIVMFALAFLVALPLITYAADPKNAYFNHLNQTSYLQSKEYEEKSTVERAQALADRWYDWLSGVAWRARPDGGDAAGTRPMLDPISIALMLGGIAIAIVNGRQFRYQILLLMIVILPLGSVVAIDGQFRRSIGILPFIAILAALPLAFLWRSVANRRVEQRVVGLVVLAAVLGSLAFLNVKGYFRELGDSAVAQWTFAQEIAAASKFMNSLPDYYVYFYSGRWGFNYETRQYLAQDSQGEDRSKEFGKHQDDEIVPGRDSLFILIPPYTNEIDAIAARYPGGSRVDKYKGKTLLFIAYVLPTRASEKDTSALPPQR